MVNQTAEAGTLIILGMPSPEVLEARLNSIGSMPRRLVIVDPQADTALADYPDAERIAAAVSEVDGEAEMTFYSIAGLRSFAPPTADLKTLFPGLKIRRTAMVSAISVPSLVAQLGDLPEPLRIWIDMPGEEMKLLAGLQAAGLLGKVAEVVLRCGVESFFEGAEDCATLQGWLAQEAFDLIETDATDPDFLDLWLHGNPLQRRVSALEEEITTRDKQLAERSEALKAAQAQADERGQGIAARDK
ncbi:hypothetical protein, partial [Thalassovita taeanensis]